MQRGLQGRYVPLSVEGEQGQAFVPSPLPPHPPIVFSSELREKFDRALLGLGRLDSALSLLPDETFFLSMYGYKEAVLSSMIEGTKSSLSDLLLFEVENREGENIDDEVQEVMGYVTALDYGLEQLKEGFPLSLRLMRNMHRILLSKGRGKTRNPGEFRRSQNWIGGWSTATALFVPPPHEHVAECMAKLELFLHDKPSKTPVLVKAALVHVQFEMIHPFLDGNGRLGRLLIILLLCSEDVLKKPMLYVSLYFKNYRQRYYDLLNEVRIEGDWEAWLDFFAEALISTATQGVETAQRLRKLFHEDGQKVNQLKRISGSVYLVLKAMCERPITSPKWLREKTGLSQATVNSCLCKLEEMGIVREMSGWKRNRRYAYEGYMQIMNEGMDLPR